MKGRESTGVVKALVLLSVTVKEGRKLFANVYLALKTQLFVYL